jgi:ABC-type phosphonate transport system ATPase subunit
MRTPHTPTEGLAIEVRDLRKSYGEVEGVRGVSFEVGRGEVFGCDAPRPSPSWRNVSA